jgi:hypothetical protein
MSNIISNRDNSLSKSGARRVTINDIAAQDDPHVYVLNQAVRITKTATHVLIPYTSEQTHDARCIELEMTFIPIDLSNYVPKEELMKNPELRRAWNNYSIDFVLTEEAKKILNTDAALVEMDRLDGVRRQRDRTMANQQPPTATRESQQNLLAQQQPMPAGSPGDLDMTMSGVNPIIVQAMDGDVSTQHRISLLRNYLEMMTDVDRKYVRSKTEDPDIRKLISVGA